MPYDQSDVALIEKLDVALQQSTALLQEARVRLTKKTENEEIGRAVVEGRG